MADPNVSASARASLSHVPSWILIGFGLGALTVWGFLSRPEPPPPVTPPAADVDATAATPLASPATPRRNPAALTDRPSLQVVEALFEQHRAWAFWDNGATQIALWNGATGAFTDFFEIRRTEEGTYYRTLDALTWWPIEYYGPDNAPIRFTETNVMRLARYRAAGIVPEERKLPPLPPPHFDLAP